MQEPDEGDMLNEAEFVDKQIELNLQKAFKVEGIEGTEDLVNRVYTLHPIARARILSVYNRLIKGGVK